MFRKIILALTASAALGALALAPTSASAWSGGHGYGHGFGHGYGYGHGYAFGRGYRGGFGVTLLAPSVDCVTYQWVRTRRGLWMQVPVDACDY